ncbi:MAG: hypothetical protein A3B07_01915 [Candidatus Yonathbacteria bacterium RIFCSPLOWO2_01_FULL_43_27]|uniref:Uncharacterized protein n=1 Tax=Candidatus Yonathbacteria bacterium RIFCSPLOWO2_01_FULL_43_27 TaxID=1802726 RepID=A0A1G2SCA3_9BACT|nr:MAG: hypothetical protein A2658_01710 [Candidatus Yonathbacteria bacterium RIFCSPHIGHO2_01_FULL_44_19]OHA82667.1 MAG: hypothetical protein A3B07_01915 [Candidatus Yonathbacteria bacterium RIFCSPLOWO2_01_FULL_43_27]
MMMPKILITASNPEGRYAVSLFEEAYNKAYLDKVFARRLNERGDELKEWIIEIIRELSGWDPSTDDEGNPIYVYPKDYKVKGIAEQVATLKSLFPELKNATFNESITTRPLPPNAEGWFAIPRWQAFAPTYGKAVEKVFAVIASTREFCNCNDGELGAEYFRQNAETVKMFQKLGDEQKGYDILVVPAQFGLYYGGRSVLRKRRQVFASKEFGLGAFAIGNMLLTHPERESCHDQLDIECTGDEFSEDANEYFLVKPTFYVVNGCLRFAASSQDETGNEYGLTSAFA